MLVNIGYENYILTNRIVSILTIESKPAKDLFKAAKENNVLINATHGKKCRTIILTDSDYIFASALQSKTIMNRIIGKSKNQEEEEIEEIEELEEE